MKRLFRDYVSDILAACDDVDSFTRDMDYSEFSADRKTVNAVVRSLEIMGEAARHIPDQVRQRYPQVPWKRMCGMRDKLIHEYSGVDLEIVWGVIKAELPPLRPVIERILHDIDGPEP